MLVGLSGAMMPGPLLTVAIDESYRRGFSAAPRLVAGHAVLEGAMVVLVGLGLEQVVDNDIF
ncbi:MAG: LysE family transporter, partial [Candidatus Geothermincolia bacterium]